MQFAKIMQVACNQFNTYHQPMSGRALPTISSVGLSLHCSDAVMMWYLVSLTNTACTSISSCNVRWLGFWLCLHIGSMCLSAGPSCGLGLPRNHVPLSAPRSFAALACTVAMYHCEGPLVKLNIIYPMTSNPRVSHPIIFICCYTAF